MTMTEVYNLGQGCRYMTYNQKQCQERNMNYKRGCRGDCMEFGFTTTCAVTAYHHLSCEFQSRSRRGVLDATLCDKSCQ
jgi:hypothetical protein